MSKPLDTFLDAHGEELIAFRRHLHAHPERSGAEHETTELVAARLDVAGLPLRVLASGTGLLCDIVVGDGHGPTVALRADIDALAMDDEKTVHYRSQVPGLAHACGHDVHTTVVLGAGLALARLAGDDPAGSRASGRIRLIFQPAEETAPGGAVDVIADGGLADVDWIFGLHCDPKLDVGYLGVRAGAITSASDLLEVRLHGPGGHTARPHRTADLVAVAGRIAAELPTRLRERCSPGEPNLVFGAIHAGGAANVIPSLAVLRGTLRAPDHDTWRVAPALVQELLSEMATPFGATVEVHHSPGVPPVVNDPAATELLATTARRVLGGDQVVPTEQSAGGDDFSWYLDAVAGSYARLGVHDPSSDGPKLDLHASTFDVDERAIGVGIRVLVGTALAALGATR
ncbi:MAG: amidohydrolase [Acidimicrobiia bacterium]